jgi:outer membrane receptor protein involved in Fe transport
MAKHKTTHNVTNATMYIRRQLPSMVLAASLGLSYPAITFAGGGVNTTIPKQTYSIPSGPLNRVLPRYTEQAGVMLGYDPALTEGIISPGLQGQYRFEEGFRELLKGSGLEVINNEKGTLELRKAPKPVSNNLPLDIELSPVNVRAKRFHEIGPLPGLGLTKEEIPGNVQSLSAKDIKDAHALSIADLLNSKLQSVNVNDYQGNPFQMDVSYRGFTASPQIGTPQGLSVFFDGIRVNEPFGDVVNWDMIPMNALSGVDVFPGSNPIFGLGTLGGAFSMRTKSGFDSEGVEAEVLTGSFGRKQLQASGGWNNGTIGLFGAGNFFLEDGWRDNSPSKVNQVFGKASYQSEKLDLNLSTLYVWNDLVGNGLLPSEMYKQNSTQSFTSPDTTENRLLQFQVSGSYFVNDNFTITAQAYRRNSKRSSLGADAYTEHMEGQGAMMRRALATGEQFTCQYNSTNDWGLPDYYVIQEDWTDFDSPFVQLLLGNPSAVPDSLRNQALPEEVHNYFKHEFEFWKQYRQSLNYVPQAAPPSGPEPGPVTEYSNGESSYLISSFSGQAHSGPGVIPGALEFSTLGDFFWSSDGTKNYIVMLNPINSDQCIYPSDLDKQPFVGEPLTVIDPSKTTGPARPIMVDGAASWDGKQPGVVAGTPTGVLTNTDIDQITDGVSVQLNWNFPKHKFMVGVSIDAPSATYKSGQMLGMMDAERNVFLAPDQIREQYAAAYTEVSNNNFKGNQLTKSIYASETWSPIETLHITGAARYNDTHGKNTVSSRTWGSRVFDLSNFIALPDYYNLCVHGVCPSTGYKIPDLSNLLNKPETEKFSYYSLNPSLGVSWQAKPDLNLYTNWAQGTRTPSVIELGCAFDSTPVKVGTNPDTYVPKSLQENRSCSLPSTLSGDPYLPQIRAQTIDLGIRGRWGDGIEWNIGAYQTDLKDDIYLVSFPGNKSFFDSIGDTRRRGIEAGITGVAGKFGFRINYALTDATFQDSFMLAADHNSSSVENYAGNYDYGRLIQVKPGNRMPGVPLHNLNATLTYELTPKWQVGLTAVAHSTSYVRGNENNEHQKGVVIYDTIDTMSGRVQVPRKTTTNPGSVPGYMMFNFQTSYQLAPEWRLGLQVNNIFDKEYFSAGRLGRNPFSPSVYGAIGPDGYNHNSSDWLSTNFLAPGAPRAAWISLSYEFNPNR